jgi:O-antigen/teichoic acid export membrane protein
VVPFAFIKKHSKTLALFAGGQLVVQFLNIIAGFLVIRWMLKEEFAKFTLAFSIQNTFGMLVEMGLSAAFLAFIGDNVNDKVHVSKYYNAVLFWRKRLLLVIIPVSLISYFYLTHGKGWDTKTMLLLYLAIPFAIYFQGFSSFYAVILQLKKDVKKVYLIQISIAVLKIVMVLIIFRLNLLFSWTYLLLNTLLITVATLMLSAKVHDLIEIATPSREAVRSVINYIKPTILGITFSAIQSQIAIVLISVFGSTSGIADMGALGRLSQLFLFLSAFNGVILQPWFARMPHRDVLKRTIMTFFFLSIFLVVVTVVSFRYPILFIKLLGVTYGNLKSEFGWIVLISSIGYLSTVINSIGSSRKWIYWWPNVVYMVIFFFTTIMAILFFNLSEVKGVINYTLLFTLLNFFLLVVYFCYGLMKDTKASS